VSVRPVAVTVLPVPTFVVSNVAEPVAHVTASPLNTPLSVHVVIVAVIVWSYGLFAAATDAVSITAVMLAVVVAVLLASV
jgi:hypothetical protein